MSFNIENYFSDRLNKNLILYCKGNVDSDAINHVLDSIEAKMVATNDNTKLRKRVYSVLVECLQNLYHHVDKAPNDFDGRHDKFGMVRIINVEGGYEIVTGNFILAENIKALKERINKINMSSKEEIRELYKYVLNHQKISAKGGGGLGLIDIARKTGNKLDYSFVKYNDEYSFFYLDIIVNELKENKNL